MRVGHIAGIALWVVLASPGIAQEKTEYQSSQSPTRTAVSTTVLPSSAAGNIAGFHLVVTQTVSGGSAVVTNSLATPGPNGRFETAAEATTETSGIGSDSITARSEVFGKNPDGRLTLVKRTDSDQHTLPAGTSRITETTWVPDVNGRLGLSYRRVQETKTVAPNVQQTEIVVSFPGVNEALRETQRVQQTQQRLGSNLILTDSVHEARDANGRWQTTETRNQEQRTIGPDDVEEEETVRRLDGNGQLTPSERTITRRSAGNGSGQTVTEIYSVDILGLTRSARPRLDLRQRIRGTTTTTSGVTETISETEARIPGVTNGPLRLLVRTTETVRQIAPDQWRTERQTFGMDGNGGLVLTSQQTEETQGRLNADVTLEGIYLDLNRVFRNPVIR